jgi:prepilin-type N-terminal cleavage/methylation domain-containing protein
MKKGGFTLIELLAALTISGIVLSILVSVLISGIKQSEKIEKEVSLQQEANHVATMLRNEYLSEIQYNVDKTLTIEVLENSIILNEDSVISDQFHYSSEIYYFDNDPETDDHYTTGEVVIIKSSAPVDIRITFSNETDEYTLRTTLSRGV